MGIALLYQKPGLDSTHIAYVPNLTIWSITAFRGFILCD